MLRVALIEFRRFNAEQFIGRNPKRTGQGNECRSGWELRFRFVIGDRALGCIRHLGELDLCQAACLPERNQSERMNLFVRNAFHQYTLMVRGGADYGKAGQASSF
jgi:hypothetical protein